MARVITRANAKIKSMQAINVRIDISTPTGKRLMREVEKHPKTATIEYPLSKEIEGKSKYTVDEVFEECYDILSEHYKCDIRKL